MDNRPGIMGRLSSDQLIDPVTYIGLNHFDAILSEKRGKSYFPGDVGLRFDHKSFISDLPEQNVARLLRISCPKDFKLVLLKSRDGFSKKIPVSERLGPDSFHFFLHLFKIIEEREILHLTGPGLFEGTPLVFQFGLFGLLS